MSIFSRGGRHGVEHLLETVHRVHACHDVRVRADVHLRFLRKIGQFPDAVKHLLPSVLLPHLGRSTSDKRAEAYEMRTKNLRVTQLSLVQFQCVPVVLAVVAAETAPGSRALVETSELTHTQSIVIEKLADVSAHRRRCIRDAPSGR